jgi:hypothetical protein
VTRWALGFALLFLSMLLVRVARADGPVIVPGREAEVVALVKPWFGTDRELAPGYKLGNIEIEQRAIRLVIEGPGAKKVGVRLEYPSEASSEKTASFAIVREDPDDAAKPAVDALIASVRANDKGDFWPTGAPAPPSASHPRSDPSRFARGADGELARWLRNPDGVLLFTAALAFVVLHLRRVLRQEPVWIAWSLAALVAIGGLLRVAIARETAMNVWPYEREVPLARAAYEGVVLPRLCASLSLQLYLTDVIFVTSLIIAVVTPLAFFAHARYVLRDAKAALFAAALLVFLPMHIRFSRSDTEFVQSLATSSVTFVVLYTALRDRSRAVRTVCFVLLPIFSVATYFVRPENMFFYLLDVAAIALTAGDEAPRRRKLFAFAEVTAAAGFAFVVHLVAQYGQTLKEAIGIRTITSAVGLFFHPRLNTLINVSITPPGLTLLAIAGGFLLYRRGDRMRALFLAGWLLGFFVVHSFVRPSEPAMQARYHMHLITPLVFLAASSLPDLLRLPRPALIAGAAYFVASPLLHLRFERDTAFNDMREFDFLRAARAKIPDGCTVLELSPAVSVEGTPTLASRLDRIAMRLQGSGRTRAFRVLDSGKFDPASGVETLSPEALEAIAKPSCLYVYLGLTCATHRPPGTPLHPVCEELRRKLVLRPVMATTFPSRVYDEVLAGRQVTSASGLECKIQVAAGEPIELALYQVDGRRDPER